MALFHLVYVSAEAELMDAARLGEILDVSRANNAERGITGLLVYKAGNFMQALEGERRDVELIYASILDDPRHRNVNLLVRGEVMARAFSDWSMGFRVLADGELLYWPERGPAFEGEVSLRAFVRTPLESYRWLAGVQPM